MAQCTVGKTAEQYLDTLKTLLGGRLPPMKQSALLQSTEDAQSNTLKEHANNNDNDNDDEDDDMCDIAPDNTKRAPLLYPPITELSVPSRSSAVDVSICNAAAHQLRPHTSPTPDTRFCPLPAVVKFPFKFVDHKHTQAVATAFFDAGKIWMRPWNLYVMPHIATYAPRTSTERSKRLMIYC